MYVLAIGASKNIGYLSSLRLLAEGHTVTFLLRNPSVFDNDTQIQNLIKEGKARLVKGDATVRSDVQNALDKARIDGQLDAVLFSVGGTPTFSPLKGFLVHPPNLCSSSLYNLLASYPEGTATAPQPKLIVISAHGLTKISHNNLPLLLKPLYSYALSWPHRDKLCMERAIFHAANWTWPEDEPKELAEFLGPEWQKQMGDPGYLKDVVVVRPSLLVDNDNKPAKGKYRATVEELPGAYKIARKEVAHFIVEGVLKNWDKWGGSVVNVSD